MSTRRRVGVGALGLAFVLAIALAATGALTPTNERVAFGASTTLTIISGSILVRHPSGDFGPAEDGMILSAGDTVRTSSDARAVLTYFEGSTVEIEPDSQVTIDAAHPNPDGSTVILMRQDLGTTWHVVTHLLQGGSTYEVHTTTATASVRGTAFTVAVEPDGTTTETTTQGAVANSDPQGIATVVTPPGQQTTTRPGQLPSAPIQVPDPDRTVTVTIGDQNSLVFDTLGRANGLKDGKKVLQTPGAQLDIVDGRLVITLPNIPDGTLATRFLGPSGSTDVTTTVAERGKAPVIATDTVTSASTRAVAISKAQNAPPASGALGTSGSSPAIVELVPVLAQAPAATAVSIDPQKNKAAESVRSSVASGGGSPVASGGGNSSAAVVGDATTSGHSSGSASVDNGSHSNPSSNGGAPAAGTGTPSSENASHVSSSSGANSPASSNGANSAPSGGATTPDANPSSDSASHASPSTGGSSTAHSDTGNGNPPGGNSNPGGGGAANGGTYSGNAGAILKDLLKDAVKGKPSK